MKGVGTGIGSFLAPIASSYLGAPWWVVVTVSILGLRATAVVTLAGIVIPQESKDRLILLQAYLDFRRSRRITASSKPGSNRSRRSRASNQANE